MTYADPPPSAQISTLLSSFRKKDFVSDVRYLSGEDQSNAISDEERWTSRHSMSEGGVKASNWLMRECRASTNAERRR